MQGPCQLASSRENLAKISAYDEHLIRRTRHVDRCMHK